MFLGRYVSFYDEVRVPDVSRAFESAIADELGPLLANGERFACISHSTGGPVIRDWWQRYYDGVRGEAAIRVRIGDAPAVHEHDDQLATRHDLFSTGSTGAQVETAVRGFATTRGVDGGLSRLGGQALYIWSRIPFFGMLQRV